TAVFVISRIISSPVILNKLPKERVRTSGIERGIGECQNVLVLPDREPLDLAKRRMFELLPQLLQEVGSPSLVVRERPAEALDRSTLVVCHEGPLAGLGHRS